jgi:hypothetical protein
MKPVVVALLLVAVVSGALHAGGTSVARALLASLNDPAIKAQNDNALILKKDSYRGIPMLDNMEFRLRNESFDMNATRYTLRLQPRGFGETRAANGYVAIFFKSNQRKEQLVKNKALRDRYIQILDHMEQREVEEITKELIVVYEDRIKVMEKRKGDVDAFDFNDLIEGEDRNTQTHTELFELKRMTFGARASIAASLHDSLFGDFDTSGFVDVDSVIAAVENHQFSFDTNNVSLDYFRLRLQMVGARYDLEKAEGRKYISFVGFSYDNGRMLDEMVRRSEDKRYNLASSYALELGLTIPDLTLARHDLARRKADYLTEKEDFEKLKLELTTQVEKDQQDLLSFIAQYRFLKARENEVDATSSLKKYLQMSGVDPLVLLSIKESIVKNHIEIAKLKYSILRNYIQVIDMAGELSRPPLKNFLSRNNEIIQP